MNTKKIAQRIIRSGGGRGVFDFDKAIERIDAALQQAMADERAAKWQPIETAPRDGTPILIAFSDGRVQQHVLKPAHVKAVWFPDGEGPTRWQPLPDPPTTQEGS